MSMSNEYHVSAALLPLFLLLLTEEILAAVQQLYNITNNFKAYTSRQHVTLFKRYYRPSLPIKLKRGDVGDVQTILQKCQRYLRLSVNQKCLARMQVMSATKTNRLALWILADF